MLKLLIIIFKTLQNKVTIHQINEYLIDYIFHNYLKNQDEDTMANMYLMKS